eukprot:gene17046-23339_t
MISRFADRQGDREQEMIVNECCWKGRSKSPKAASVPLDHSVSKAQEADSSAVLICGRARGLGSTRSTPPSHLPSQPHSTLLFGPMQATVLLALINRLTELLDQWELGRAGSVTGCNPQRDIDSAFGRQFNSASHFIRSAKCDFLSLLLPYLALISAKMENWLAGNQSTLPVTKSTNSSSKPSLWSRMGGQLFSSELEPLYGFASPSEEVLSRSPDDSFAPAMFTL